ncbi:probable serine/threonine-protein kinase kinX isoform X2 [Salvelinus alpinus]|uniref:probable serine/threonine-protein kinase kinX isoform X2 n=1 Tax=Salvelinus alpinus TaxID=8036 RepID=UPI0039FCCBE8
MDSVDEDVSARVLLQSVIHTESSRSPITRSASQAQFQSPGSRVRRSIRLRRSDVGALTPQEALKQSIKNKLREVWLNRSTSRFSLPVPPSKRRTISEGVRKINTPAPATASLLYDDDITPRYLLRGILQTEPETSLLVQDRPVKKEPELPYTNSSLHSNRPSTGLSDLDLPDMTTTVNLSNTVKGLSRKRPRRSLNITAFNRQLEHEDGEGEGGSATEKYLSSLSSASPSSITFSLKTPFVDVQTEKRGFQRKVTNRKKICLEEFDKALQNRQAAMGGDPELSVREDQQGLSETIRSEGFTSGLSDLTAPDITHDIITSNTALYSLPVDTATTFTITTQDKDTITGTQIQREMGGMKDEDEKDMEEVGEQNENKMELDNKDGEDLAGDAGQREDSVRQKESKSQTEEVEAVADSQTEEEDEVAESQTEEEDEVAESQTEEEDEVAESQTEEDEVAESQTEEDEVAESQTEEDEVAESQTEEDEVTESQTAEDEVTESQTAEDEVTESQTAEDEVAESQTAEDEVAETQTAEDEVAESQTAEDEVAESQTAEDEVAESQTAEDEVAESQTAEDEVAESQTAEDEVAESQTADDVADEGGQVVEEGQEKRLTSQSLTHNAKHISRRAYCSEGGGKVAGVIEGGRGYKSMGAAVVVEVVAVAYSQTEEEDEVAESQTEEDEVAESQTEEDEVAESQTEEDEVAESQTEEDEVAESQTADDVADEGGQVVEEGQEKRLTSQSLTHNAKHISRRAYCSEGGGKVAGVIEGGRGYKSMGAALHPTETGWAGRRSEGDTAGEWHSGPEVGASESAHTRTVTLGSVPPSLLPQEDEQELEGLSRTGTSCGNEEMENSMPPLEMTFEPENNTPHSSNSSLHPITAQSPAEHEEDWDDVEEGDGIRSEGWIHKICIQVCVCACVYVVMTNPFFPTELSMKTPAFVREKRNALPIDPLATPTVLKDLQPSVLSGAAAAVKPKAVRGKRTGSAKKDPGLSKSYIMSVFKHFAKTKVSTDVYPVLKEIMERYFDRLADDLETFAAHAKRKTIEVEDVELLMRRQGFLTDSMPVNVLIEKYLPMESRKLLIPVATSGNYVIPKPRRK